MKFLDSVTLKHQRRGLIIKRWYRSDGRCIVADRSMEREMP